MSKSELFKQAIADAKELKDITMATAKQQIAEAFAPKIQEMFRMKVNELDNMDEVEEMEEADKMEENSSIEEVNEMSLDEILAELEADDAMNEEDENLEEGQGYEAGAQKPEIEEAKDDKADDKKEDKKDAPKKDAAPKKDDDAADDVDDVEDLGGDDLEGADLDLGTDVDAGAEEVAELSVEEFKNLVRDVVADVLAGHNEPEADNLDGDAADLDMGMGSDMGADGAEDDSISLDEILAELEAEGLEENETMDEMSSKEKMAKGLYKEEDELEEVKKEDELEEAVATIEELKATINEMNLFNAKLLYTNKIFEAKSLNNTQKTKVLNAFDKAASLNEVKAVYKALTSTLETSSKKTLKESIGFASKPMGNAPAKPIMETDAIVNRFQQLAGIKKLY